MGQHKVVAVTLDGKDKVTTNAEAKAGEQTLVSIALQPVRNERTKKPPEPSKDEQAAALGQLWTDPKSQLMWTVKDNGRNVNWKQASDYCGAMTLAGHADWRLPSIDELRTLYDPTINIPGIGETGGPVSWHVRGNLRLTGWQWSRSQADVSGEAWGLSLASGRQLTGRVADNLGNRALCVRHPDN